MNPVFIEGLEPQEVPPPAPVAREPTESPGPATEEAAALGQQERPPRRLVGSEPLLQPFARGFGTFESSLLLAAEELLGLIGVLDVQAGYLRLLEESVAERPQDRALVRGALEARASLEEGMLRFRGLISEGVPDRGDADLSQALIGMIPHLAREVGDGSRLRVAPPVDPLPVRVNLGLLRRALAHLVQNAREASKPGQPIRISWGRAPDGSGHPLGSSGPPDGWQGVRIRVEDRGEGVPREHMPWLFEPLFSSRSEHHPLRGLGLPLARAIAEGHGGWLEIRSGPGEGTFADLFLPLQAGVVNRSSEGRPASGTLERASTKSIILIEDEPLLARLLEQTLARAGYDVELFTTQQESERHFQSGGGDADLMIVERILAGGRSGREIARDWQRRQPSLKVMMIDRDLSSGFAPAESDSDAVGPTMSPPFVPQDIVRRVKEMLDGTDEIVTSQSEEVGDGPLKAH